MYPFMINIKNKPIVIVGGGKVATNRVLSLLPFEPNITVVSPTIDERLKPLYKEKQIQYEKRTFHPTDVKDAFIVIAATDCYETNQQVKSSCHRNQLYNIVDDPKGSSFHFPAIHRNNGITFGVTTSGISPTLAKHLRNQFAKIVDEYDENYLTFLQEVRKLIKQKELHFSQKHFLLQQCLQKKFVKSEEERKTFFETIQKL